MYLCTDVIWREKLYENYLNIFGRTDQSFKIKWIYLSEWVFSPM